MTEFEQFLDHARGEVEHLANAGGARDFAGVLQRLDEQAQEHLPARETHEGMADGAPDELERWVHSVQGTMNQRWSSTPPRPNFADVLVRVEGQASHPAESHPAEVQRDMDTKVVEMRPEPGHPMVEHAVDIAIADTRAVVERRVEASKEIRLGEAQPSEQARRRGSLAGVFLAAAGFIGLCSFAAPRVLDIRAEGMQTEQAVHTRSDSDDGGVARQRNGQAAEPKGRMDAVPLEPSIDAVEVPVEESDAAPPVQPEPTTRPRARGSRADLGALAEEADRRWKQGDLAGAKSRLNQIVRRGGRSHRVEMAYADLFTLAKQQKNTQGRARLFRSYLRKFPRGRFAEDARAGLCRVASSTARGACWREYSERYPRGAYASEAAKGQR